MQILQALGRQLCGENRYAGGVSRWPRETCRQTCCGGVSCQEYNWHLRNCIHRDKRGQGADAHYQLHLCTKQLAHKRTQLLLAATISSGINGHVLANDEATFHKTLTQTVFGNLEIATWQQQADSRHVGGRLRARPPCEGAKAKADSHDELSKGGGSHRITSSALSRIDCGIVIPKAFAVF